MAAKFSPTQQQDSFFRAALIKWGIESENALKVARILALNISEENLTQREAALVKGVCHDWLKQRKQAVAKPNSISDTSTSKEPSG